MSKHALKFEGERSRSKTQQHFRETANINQIMAKAKRTGVLPVRGNEPFFGDYSGVTDYKESMDKIKAIDSRFMELPPKVRKKFANNPQEILEFLNDPKNDDEAREIGLLRPLTFDEAVAAGKVNPDGTAVITEEPKTNEGSE